MNRKSNRSCSNSPSSSVDSLTRRKLLTKKKTNKSLKSKEDVQVFTSLPPKVEGEIKCYLKLQIAKIKLVSNEENPKQDKSNKSKSNSNNVKTTTTSSFNENLIARCVWWGEENSLGSIFRPQIIDSNPSSNRKIQTTAKYMIRSGTKQFKAYLNDMKTLDIDLINESIMELIGRVQIFEISQLSTENPIKGYFPAFNQSQVKIADVYVSITLESLRDSVENGKKSSDQSLMSEHSRPVTPSSMANINEFNNKYELFEQQQLIKNGLYQNQQPNIKTKHQTQNPSLSKQQSLRNENEFNSDIYIGESTNSSSSKNPIIQSLIERGERLKNEMIKSSLTNINFDPTLEHPERLINPDRILTSTLSHQQSTLPFDTYYLNSNLNNNNFSFTNEFDVPIGNDLNDVSRLSDPLHDPNLLTALVYDNPDPYLPFNPSYDTKANQEQLDDEELRELLNPTDLINKLVKKDLNKTNKFNVENSKLFNKNDTNKVIENTTANKEVNSRGVMSTRRRSMSHSSISSNGSSDTENDYEAFNGRSNNVRVSFEIQSSDGESSIASGSENTLQKCIDVLSPQRLSLLNLVQIAKLKIEKMSFFSSTNLTSIIERINRIEQFNQIKQEEKKSNNLSSKSKPPKAIKNSLSNSDMAQLFFIEYQFPVVASSREQTIKRSNYDSQDDYSTLMATQKMRVVSKRIQTTNQPNGIGSGSVSNDDAILFEHTADYSVLFNSQSIENWWRSFIIFKIYCRSPNSKMASCLKSGTPYLIGTARLALRSVLKSRNFKLLKKLALIDQLNEIEKPNSTNAAKRIGTLHVSVELSSDLAEFSYDLLKLRNQEDKNLKNSKIKKLKNSRSKLENLKEPHKDHQNHIPYNKSSMSGHYSEQNNQIPERLDEKQSITTKQASTVQQPATFSNFSTSLNTHSNTTITSSANNLNSIEEISLPIEMYLSINEDRGFNTLSANSTFYLNDSIYLICRLFWNKEKVKFESNSTPGSYDNNSARSNSHFSWTLNLSFMIKMSQIEKMKNNFMIIEAWKRSYGSNESLIGTIKLPLHEFYLKFKDFNLLKKFLSDSVTFPQPLVGVNGWISAFDPFTGYKAGEINVLLAMGSNQQMLNLQKLLFDQSRIRMNANPAGDMGFNYSKEPSIINQNNDHHQLVEHVFSISLENIKIHPMQTSVNNQMILDETDYYVRYLFPVSDAVVQAQSGQNFRLNLNNFLIATKVNTNFENRNEHKIISDKKTNINNLLLRKFLESDNTNNKNVDNEEKCFILFEVWSRSYFPNLREKVIAKGELHLDRIFSLVDKSQNRVNARSFIIPLISNEQRLEDEIIYSKSNNFIDKFIGQLFLNVEYKCLDYEIGDFNMLNTTSGQESNSNSHVMMSVGVLRAVGLQLAVSNAANKNTLKALNLENSDLSVKFSLAFMNRPQDTKQTRRVLTRLNGFSPEFFDYFDIKCPLVSSYNSSSRRTVSLAEQLEMGQLVFELWSKFVDPNSKANAEVLLGTCTVPLNSLLENRIGIRGWLPIQSPTLSSTNLSSHVNFSTSSHNVGGLEIVIRFTRHDDFLKVINAAKDIGWIRANDFEFNRNQTTNKIFPFSNSVLPLTNESTNQVTMTNHNDRLILDNLHDQATISSQMSSLTLDSAGRPKQTVKCLIEIEKAVHLPTIYDEKLNRHNAPNAFVTFNANSDNPSELVKTPVSDRQISPTWNYQILANIDSEYFLEESKYFIFKIWHKISIETGSSSPSNRTSNKILGYASVDLTPLIYGLSHISGWYNVQDSIGNSQGQIKLNILPQENLFALKQVSIQRKKNLSKISNEKRINSFNSRIDSASIASSSVADLSKFQLQTPINSNSTNDLTDHDGTNLKSDLTQKLSELEKLNKTLKERLEKQNTQNKIGKNFSKSEVNLSNKEVVVVAAIEKDVPNELSFSPNVEFKNELEKIENPVDKQQEKEVENEKEKKQEILNEPLNNLKAENQDNKLIELRRTNWSELSKYPFDQNGSVLDSFWASSVDGRQSEKLNDNSLDSSQIQNNIFETIPSSRSDRVEHLPPIFSKNENENQNVVAVEEVNTNTNDNDTDLDQTFNLNASYEIVPNRTSLNGSPLIVESYDIIDKADDFNKLDENNINLSQNEINLKSFNENDCMNNNELNNLNELVEEEEQDLDDNVTIVIPEQLNKIEDSNEPHESKKLNDNNDNKECNNHQENESEKEHPKPASETDLINEKFKTINSKIPNYFLPKEDLAKSMRQLHYNYTEIVSANPDKEEQNKGQNLILTSKSTIQIVKNKNSLKQDLTRINKIFHSKLN